MIFLTADNHFGHKNILTYCQRPFANAKEMDRVMIERWNEVVEDGDTVYHLGDFTLSGLKVFTEIAGQLKGKLEILSYPYHHDKRWLAELNRERAPIFTASGHEVALLPALTVLKFTQPRLPSVTLCHFPLADWLDMYHGGICLHGHSHARHHAPGRIYDVGVDNNDYAPVSIVEVLKILMEKEELEHENA